MHSSGSHGRPHLKENPPETKRHSTWQQLNSQQSLPRKDKIRRNSEVTPNNDDTSHLKRLADPRSSMPTNRPDRCLTSKPLAERCLMERSVRPVKKRHHPSRLLIIFHQNTFHHQ
ncbi:unnamed protein product [Lupinus luteus]|uniref:Uncharacterized protein n=1 Tax=Lupinus luteus TaxID=3873 RepID=A0AAV1WY94_LUPLU